MDDVAQHGILPLTVDALTCRRGDGDVSVLEQVSMTIEPRTRNVVIGPNGAGKSTLLRLLHGLVEPSSGRIRWHDADPERIRRAQAMVFQRPVMLRRTARENVEFALRIARSGRSVGDAANDALERVRLLHLADRPARLCSIGEQQRIALARAWAMRPEVLFLDEPTSSLDPAATRAIEDIIGAMHLAGTTIMMSTHDLGQARRMSDRVLFLHQGRLLEDRASRDFFPQPRSPEAAAFIRGELTW